MADIKIDESEFLFFLTKVKELLSHLQLNKEDTQEREQIIHYINQKFEKRELMMKRKSYYEFYIKNKKDNIKAANQAYQKYLEIKEEIERIE